MRDLVWRTVLATVLCLGVGESYRRIPQEVPVPPTPPVEEPFLDVEFGQRWYDGAQYGYHRGLVRGISETEFGGELPATRAMAATMVWRMAGQPEVLGPSQFRDVGAGKYYTGAVVWGESLGLWEGYGDGTFRPDAGVTWEQLELILGRYLGTERIGEGAVRTFFTAETDRGMNRGELAEALMELCERKRGK